MRQAQVRGLPPARPQELFDEQQRGYRVELEPPPPSRLFRLESETRWRERIRQEFRQLGRPVAFPEEVSFAEATPAERTWQPTRAITTPRYVCYNPLYFEEKNAERYGWNLGMFQPIASTGKFYLDFITFPYNTGVIHPCAYESSAGYCLPNDRVPYMVYVPPLSIKGAFLQAGAVAGGIAIFP